METVAIVREVSPGIGSCELTHMERALIDVPLAIEQHLEYVDCLRGLGCHVEVLPGDPDLPDCVFVEDTALVFDELAVILRPGAVSRRPETRAVARALEPYRSQIRRLEAPARLDGGDVLTVGKTVYVGLSSRSNRDGIDQLQKLIGEFGYEVRSVEFDSCLHLKSAATRVAEDTVLVQAEWVDPRVFDPHQKILVDPSEPYGGNALAVAGAVVYASGFDRTRERLEAHGLTVHTVPQSELAKAEGAVTCGSLIFQATVET